MDRERYDFRMRGRPSKQRTTHGHLVSIWMRLADRRVRMTRAQLEAYLAGPDFLASFQMLDPERRLLALQAAGVALDRLPIEPGVRTVEPAIRIKWTDQMKDHLREAARRLPDDKAIARELRLPLTKTKAMRWKLVGPRRSTPHISRRGPLRVAG
jgi:hypothetical protein